jgi:hypothetical protein
LPAISALVAATALALTAAAAGAAPDPPRPIAAGDVLTLGQTPHLWIVDGQAIARFAGDPRALAGLPIDWATSRDVTAAELGALARGGPRLSAALVRIGDAIYAPGFADADGPPTLYHVGSAADLAFLGVDAANYGQLVLEQGAWEQRYGLAVAGLPSAELDLGGPPAVGPALPAPATRAEGDPD